MTASVFFDRVKMTTATTGTSTITLGSAVTDATNGDCLSFAAAGVSDGDPVRYLINDGHNWEIGQGTYTASGTTLSRDASCESSSGPGVNITLSGSATVALIASSADLISVAVGTMVRGVSAPGGTWLPCDGSIYAKASYPALATALGSIVDVATWTLRSSMAPASSTGLAPYPAWELNTFNAVAYVSGTGGSSIWVAAGNAGIIYRSTDGGDTWTKITSGTSQNLYGVACDGSGNLVAVGAAGTLLYSSNSGASWTAGTSGVSQDIGAVAFGASTWVIAVANAGGSANAPTALQASTVSGSWSSAGTLGTATSVTANALRPFVISYLNGNWVACGSGGATTWNPSGSTGSIAYSTTLTGSWSTKATGINGIVCAITYFNGVFVAATNTSAIAYVYASTISGSWTSISNPAISTSCFATDGTTLLNLGYSAGPTIGFSAGVSTTGTTFATQSTVLTCWGVTGSSGLVGPLAFAYGGGTWIAVGTAGGVLKSTNTGLSWVNRGIGWSNASINWACYGNGWYAFFGTNGLLVTTPDLVNSWKIGTPGTAGTFTKGYYLNSQFVALNNTTSLYQPATTNDPTTAWSAVATTPVAFNALAWDGTNSVWIGVANSGGVYTATSLTGAWTQRAVGLMPSANFSDVASGSGITVAVGAGTGLVYSSAPTSTWVIGTGLAYDYQLGANVRVIFGPGSKFVLENTQGAFYSSPDGNVWTPMFTLYSGSTSLAAGPNSLLINVGPRAAPVVTQDGVSFHDVKFPPIPLVNTTNQLFCLNGVYVGLALSGTIISAPEYSYSTSDHFAVPNDLSNDPTPSWIKAA